MILQKYYSERSFFILKEHEKRYKQIFRCLSLGMLQNEISKLLSTDYSAQVDQSFRLC